jgi:hypothetical protein
MRWARRLAVWRPGGPAVPLRARATGMDTNHGVDDGIALEGEITLSLDDAQ